MPGKKHANLSWCCCCNYCCRRFRPSRRDTRAAYSPSQSPRSEESGETSRKSPDDKLARPLRTKPLPKSPSDTDTRSSVSNRADRIISKAIQSDNDLVGTNDNQMRAAGGASKGLSPPASIDADKLAKSVATPSTSSMPSMGTREDPSSPCITQQQQQQQQQQQKFPPENLQPKQLADISKQQVEPSEGSAVSKPKLAGSINQLSSTKTTEIPSSTDAIPASTVSLLPGEGSQLSRSAHKKVVDLLFPPASFDQKKGPPSTAATTTTTSSHQSLASPSPQPTTPNLSTPLAGGVLLQDRTAAATTTTASPPSPPGVGPAVSIPAPHAGQTKSLVQQIGKFVTLGESPPWGKQPLEPIYILTGADETNAATTAATAASLATCGGSPIAVPLVSPPYQPISPVISPPSPPVMADKKASVPEPLFTNKSTYSFATMAKSMKNVLTQTGGKSKSKSKQVATPVGELLDNQTKANYLTNAKETFSSQQSRRTFSEELEPSPISLNPSELILTPSQIMRIKQSLAEAAGVNKPQQLKANIPAKKEVKAKKKKSNEDDLIGTKLLFPVAKTDKATKTTKKAAKTRKDSTDFARLTTERIPGSPRSHLSPTGSIDSIISVGPMSNIVSSLDNRPSSTSDLGDEATSSTRMESNMGNTESTSNSAINLSTASSNLPQIEQRESSSDREAPEVFTKKAASKKAANRQPPVAARAKKAAKAPRGTKLGLKQAKAIKKGAAKAPARSYAPNLAKSPRR